MSWSLDRRRIARLRLPLCAAAGLAAYAGMVASHLSHSTLRGPQTPAFLACYTVAFIAYLAALYSLERQARLPLWLVFGAALAAQLLLLFTVPTLSDDVYRYLWDGHVANHGISPYAHAIADPKLGGLDVPIRGLANHPEMASPYLPAAQWLFRAVAFLFPLQPVYMQAVMVMLSLGSGGLIVRLLAIAGLPTRRAAIYLWNPLVIVETAHGAHVDTWMVLLTLLAAWLALVPVTARWARVKRKWLSPVTLALATLTKVVPALLLPVLWWRWCWPGRVFYVVVTIALLLPAGLAAGWGFGGPSDGTGLFGALRIYNSTWEFNNGLYHGLEELLVAARAAPAGQWARILAAALLLIVLGAVWRMAKRHDEPRDLLRLMAVPFMGYILLTTTVHPWYLLILVAFLPFLSSTEDEPGRGWGRLAPWLYLSWALALSYLSYVVPGDVREIAWVRVAEWLPVWSMLLLGATGQFRRWKDNVLA